ncbi:MULTISPECIES: helix-turn-helix domain-containing protein [Sphingobacterium]|uniref:HTH araC/xylS-type domain-containing protein n=1 Tax=Sphingobacterium ginsenosidimutans TaxID=687845 RepID=A0ABP8AD89_9SPHI|nr:AraC family transcriptional regulator [Sphingobacterium sp. BIGb0165]MCS4225468.1 AraC-like DNA-binding protein [Sphingobacterium sp. BIGb0165]
MTEVLSPHNKRRSEEITIQYFELLDRHLSELVNGTAMEMLELKDIASVLCISQKHLIKIIQETSGNHPCHFYVHKILTCTKDLLTNSTLTISAIAQTLTYDPSNFTKFFKKYEGITPSEFRQLKKAKSSP